MHGEFVPNRNQARAGHDHVHVHVHVKVNATLKLFSARDHEKGTELLARIVSMLTKMMKFE